MELSKYITSHRLSMPIKKQLFNRLMGLVGTDSLKLSKLNSNKYLKELVNVVQKNDLQNIETSIHHSLENNIPFTILTENLIIQSSKKTEFEKEYIQLFAYINSIKDEENKKKIIRDSIDKYNEVLKNIDKFDDLIKQQNSDINSLQSEWIKITNKLAKKISSDTINLIQKSFNLIDTTSNLTNLEFVQHIKEIINKNSYLSNQSKKIVNIDQKIDTIEIDKGNAVRIFSKKILDQMTQSEYSGAMYKLPDNLSTEQITQQIQINSIIQSAEQSTRSSFSLPSESDLINALAIFLANRAKREALIWFMDNLKERISDPIVLDAFPSTSKFIYDNPSEVLTDFNISLRRAMADDFINLPDHLLNSPWINQHYLQGKNLKNTKELIKIGSELLSLVHSQYTYRDIIKHFQLNTSFDEKNNSHLIFHFLYMVTNEFFTIDLIDNTAKYRLLGFEELSNISLDQWEVFKTLLSLKYNSNVYSQLISKYNYDDKMIKTDILEKQLKSISSLLMTLSQFDKLANRTEKINPNDILAPSLWKNLEKVLENVYSNFALDESFKKDLEILKKIIPIYENVYNKNFDQVVKNTLDFLKNYISDNDIKLSITEQSIKFDSKIPGIANLSLKNTFNLKSASIIFKQGNVYIDTSKISHLDSIRNELKYTNYYLKNLKEFKDSSALNHLKIKHTQVLIAKLFELNKKNPITKEHLQLVNLILKLSENPLEIFNDPILGNLKFANKDKNVDPFNNIMKIATFFTDINNSTDAKSLASAIDKNVLPPTSYINKRKRNFSIDLNGYVGVYGGHLCYKGNDSTKYKNGGIYGITAPVGINLSIKNFSLFIKAIDLGNLVSQYLWAANPETKNDDINFRQVINPGISAIWHIPKSPFVLFLGTSVVLNEDFNTKQDRLNLWQKSAGIKIDIPIINLNRKKY
ncbi:hypothetical protein ACFRAE_09375 [Sphingobacterium sp. HJSM2_6]|uniref:hypothetical protein n=1 Tax=Sphingobacterium sp. HJSM2_6 TaxID=3366264 RepID=UPI003BC466C9